MDRCDELGQRLAHTVQSIAFALSYADSLAAQGNGSAADRVEDCQARGLPAAAMQRCRNLADDLCCSAVLESRRLWKMLGATVINPIIKIVTVVAILAATYFFIVKPVLDTTESTFDAFGTGFGDLLARSRRTSTRHSRRRIAPAPCRASIAPSPAPTACSTRSASAAASSASRPRQPRPKYAASRSAVEARPALALGQLALDPVEAAQLPPRLSIACTSVASRVAGTAGEPFS